VEVLTSLQEQLEDIKVIYVEFCSEQDRKQIDLRYNQHLAPDFVIMDARRAG